MSTHQQVLIVGRMGRDPERRVTGNGAVMASFSLATEERIVKADGTATEYTEWHDITVWGPMAEAALRDLKKGMLVTVVGRLRTREWEGQNGAKNKTTNINAVSVAPCLRFGGPGDELPRQSQPTQQALPGATSRPSPSTPRRSSYRPSARH